MNFRSAKKKNAGVVCTGRQKDYVSLLAFHLLEGEEARQAAADLNELVEKNGWHLEGEECIYEVHLPKGVEACLPKEKNFKTVVVYEEYLKTQNDK